MAARLSLEQAAKLAEETYGDIPDCVELMLARAVLEAAKLTREVAPYTGDGDGIRIVWSAMKRAAKGKP